jgi:hypothetical protein
MNACPKCGSAYEECECTHRTVYARKTSEGWRHSFKERTTSHSEVVHERPGQLELFPGKK